MPPSHHRPPPRRPPPLGPQRATSTARWPGSSDSRPRTDAEDALRQVRRRQLARLLVALLALALGSYLWAPEQLLQPLLDVPPLPPTCHDRVIVVDVGDGIVPCINPMDPRLLREGIPQPESTIYLPDDGPTADPDRQAGARGDLRGVGHDHRDDTAL